MLLRIKHVTGAKTRAIVQTHGERDEVDRAIQTMLDAETIRYLEDLAGKGTHGSSVPAVGRKLIEEGIRTAIKEGFDPSSVANAFQLAEIEG